MDGEGERMRRASSARGGDEGELLEQLILLELFEASMPEQGDFCFVSNGVSGGRKVAELAALNWSACVGEDRAGKWASFPLWRWQREPLAAGESLSTAGLAMLHLAQQRPPEVGVRWLFSHPSAADALMFQEYCQHWSEQGAFEFAQDSAATRLLQITGGDLELLRELAYVGGVRAPGVAVIRLEDMAEKGLSQLLETFLMRRFWVMLCLPTQPLHKTRAVMPQSYQRLLRIVHDLQFPGLKYVLEARAESWRAGQRFERWLLSPGMELESLAEQIWGRVEQLFGDGFGLRRAGGQIEGLQVLPLSHKSFGTGKFDAKLPYVLMPQLEIDRGKVSDLYRVVRLWENLMDEHAEFDEHFRRRPLARLYLQHSLSSQLGQPDYLLLVVRWKRDPVGFLTAQVLRAPLFQDSRIGQIIDVYLLPKWRGKGIGGELVRLVTEWFLSIGITQFDLNVAVHNERGRAFWAKQGMEPYLQVVSKDIA